VGSASGQTEILAMLIDTGADINACSGSKFGNALQLTAYMGNIEAVKLLISAGADLNRQGPLGTAIQLASSRQHQDIVRIFDSGADISDMS
jgi:ankyrin repeat protein